VLSQYAPHSIIPSIARMARTGRTAQRIRERSPIGARLEQLSRLFWIFAVLPLLAQGCLQSDATLHVKGDGSGTMEMSLLVNDSMASMMTAGTATAEGEEPRIMSDAELIARGSQLGEGVRFVSSEKLEQPGFQGVKAVYEFDDIRKIRMQMSPSDDPSQTASEPITFGFMPAKDGVAHLSIHIPSDPTKTDSAAPSDSSAKPTAEEIEQMSAIFGGLRISAKLVTDGEIVKTNSPYQEGSTVTLLEMDFDQLLSDVDKLTEVVSLGQPKDLADLTERLRGIPGIKINPTDTVTIDFSAR
jgi:hypothetical protein